MSACEHINNIIKDRYDIDLLAGSLDPDHLLSVYEHYVDQKETLSLLESADQKMISKAFLIAEAARMILKEIAPKRTKRKSK